MTRHHWILTLALIPWLLAQPALGRETGVSLRAGLGSNTCVSSGEADCAEVSSHLGVQGALGYRFHRYVGLYGDVAVGRLAVAGPREPAADIELTTLSVTPMLRVFAPLGPVELSAGLGAGYARTALDARSLETGEHASIVWSTWFAPRVEAALGVPIGEFLVAGVSGAMQFHPDFAGRYCHGDGECRDNEGSVIDLFQGAAFLMATF